MIDPTEYGLGAQPSPPDPRDFPIDQQYAALGVDPLVAASALPARYEVGSLPPVANQGTTPECVSYSCAYEKQRQDRLDEGAFFRPNYGRFFTDIGGGPSGAVMRTGLQQMLGYGYPDLLAHEHKIRAYYSVPVTVADIKTAIATYGGVLVIGPWARDWCPWLGGGPNVYGVLPSYNTEYGGHAWWAIGWDDAKGLEGYQSWGSGFGLSGRFFVRYSDVPRMWEAWKTTDVVEYQAKAMACGAQIRPDVHFGASLGTIAAGAGIRVAGKVAGSAWTRVGCTNGTVPAKGTAWYDVRVIGGQAVGIRFPGHSRVFIYAGGVKGG